MVPLTPRADVSHTIVLPVPQGGCNIGSLILEVRRGELTDRHQVGSSRLCFTQADMSQILLTEELIIEPRLWSVWAKQNVSSQMLDVDFYTAE